MSDACPQCGKSKFAPNDDEWAKKHRRLCFNCSYELRPAKWGPSGIRLGDIPQQPVPEAWGGEKQAIGKSQEQPSPPEKSSSDETTGIFMVVGLIAVIFGLIFGKENAFDQSQEVQAVPQEVPEVTEICMGCTRCQGLDIIVRVDYDNMSRMGYCMDSFKKLPEEMREDMLWMQEKLTIPDARHPRVQEILDLDY